MESRETFEISRVHDNDKWIVDFARRDELSKEELINAYKGIKETIENNKKQLAEEEEKHKRAIENLTFHLGKNEERFEKIRVHAEKYVTEESNEPDANLTTSGNPNQ